MRSTVSPISTSMKLVERRGDGLTDAIGKSVVQRASGITRPFLVAELDGNVLLSLYGRSCRHLTLDQVDALIEELQAVRNLAERLHPTRRGA